jgi:hypothetical protein
MANLNSESCHSLIGFLMPEYLGFLKLQVIPRFTGTGTCISPVPVNRNRGILTSLMPRKMATVPFNHIMFRDFKSVYLK